MYLRQLIISTTLAAVLYMPVAGLQAAESLHDAVRGGDIELVLSLLNSGGDINDSGEAEGPPLFLAVSDNNLEMAKFLIEKGADIEGSAKVGKLKPLHRAATNNNAEMIKLLATAGAKVNSKEFQKKTPLIMAAWEGNLHAINALIEAGADVNETERRLKLSPLHFAARAGQFDAVKLLLKHGADVNAVARRGRTVLYSASFEDSVAVMNGTEMITYLAENGALGAEEVLLEKKSRGGPVEASEESYRAYYDALVAELERIVSEQSQ